MLISHALCAHYSCPCVAGSDTLVSRGRDLFTATHIHRLLQALLGLSTPGYHHHGLLNGADGKRLSKRDGALTIRALRESGHTVAEVRGLAGFS